MPALIVDPALQASVIRQFNLKGELAPFNLTEQVVPIFDIGRLVTAATVQEVVTPGELQSVRIGVDGVNGVLSTGSIDAEDGEIFDDTAINPGAGTVLADTGQLAAGRHVIQASVGHNDATPRIMELQWRDAANAVTLANMRVIAEQNAAIKINVNIATDERLRWVTTTAVTNTAVSWIMAVLYFPALAV